jgi:signal transduction histidine kinase
MNPARRTRSLQIGFLVLLAIGSAQLAWWLIDQVVYTRSVRARIEAAYRADTAEASALRAAGAPRSTVERLYPHLTLDSGRIGVSPGIIAQLDRERSRRLNRYAWEGAFFLAVLLGAMAVVYRALREEAELRRRQESFLAAVSHELKSPLASLRLSAETMALRDPPADRRAELVTRLLEDLTRLERLIGNILDTSRVAASAPATAPEPIALAEEVKAVIGEMSLLATENGTTVTAEVPPTIQVRAGREAIRTVLRNLLHNAIRAAAGGRVTISAAARQGQVQLLVRDDGAGFPPNEGARLFEKFYRLEGEGRERQGGTGLGLYLVRRYVELDGGSVQAMSGGPGQGASFTVTWPVPEGEPA